jgi:osmotically inducible lipoprotein OsmB
VKEKSLSERIGKGLRKGFTEVRLVKKSQIVALALAGLAAAGCSGLNEQQQRALSGGALGAAGGAAVGALTGSTVTGALIGAAAGTAGGLLYHESKK